MTDARHGWRQNSKDTSVVALGEQTHKVMGCVHITKSQDKVAQRHERLGTPKIYENIRKNLDRLSFEIHPMPVAVANLV
jgi:hypothetical protein